MIIKKITQVHLSDSDIRQAIIDYVRSHAEAFEEKEGEVRLFRDFESIETEDVTATVTVTQR